MTTLGIDIATKTTTQAAPITSVSRPRRVPSKLMVWLAFAALLVIFALLAGRLLVRDTPQKSDVIVVLAGHSFDERYNRGLELLRAGYGQHMFIDINPEHHLFGRRMTDYAAEFIDRDTGDMRPFVRVCPFAEDSTVTESKYVSTCLAPLRPHKVLLVTSDFHSARALSVFKHRLPQYEWSVAAARDRDMFGEAWWRHRECEDHFSRMAQSSVVECRGSLEVILSARLVQYFSLQSFHGS